jgi:adhesin transport system membrane fusion protein
VEGQVPSVDNFEDLGELGNSSRRMVQVICASLLLFIVWASLFTLDVVSVAEGEVIPADKVQSVQHLEGGVISKILVAEGELVEQGQVLVELESTSSGASVAELQLRVDSLGVDILRLQALMSDDPALLFDDTASAFSGRVRQQAQSLFQAQKLAHDNAMAVQDEEVVRRQKEAARIATRLSSNRDRLTLLQEQIKISEELLQSEVTSRYEHINLLKEANTLSSSIAQDVEAAQAMQSEISQARKARDNLDSEFKQSVSAEHDRALRSHAELSERLKTYEDNLQRTILTAPTSGIVKSIYLFTTGGVVAPGATVLDLVPDSSNVVVEARLQPQDIAYVGVGDLAFVRLNSADSIRFGSIEGTVATISPDTLVSEQGVPFYQVKLTMDRDYFESGDVRYPLVPGMVVTAGVVTGERSVLRYLLSPLLTTTWFALSER